MMPAATTAEASRWSDLPFDLLAEISCRLHAAGDYVRFHAVCRSWRDTLPPATPAPCRRPSFLPWLLARCHDDAAAGGGHRTARCVSSMKLTSRRRQSCCATTTTTRIPDANWVIRGDDGTAAWILNSRDAESSVLVDPVAGSPAIPILIIPGKDNWMKRAMGFVSGDGTILLYAFGMSYYSNFDLALLHSGDTAWTMVRIPSILDISPENRDRFCIAYYKRKIVACLHNSWCVATTEEASEAASRRDWWRRMPCEEPGFQSSYVVESRGELLWVFVHVNFTYGHFGCSSLISVLVYTLQEADDSGKQLQLQWVRKDSHSLCDRVLFLGRPRSFAVDATRLGMAGTAAGCAYFVLKLNRWCRVYKYNFDDGKSEPVEQLPADWSDEDCMWLTPKPAIATTEEIRERLDGKAPVELQRRFGSYFRIYVGNLPRKVDSYRLRQFFSKHGMVADARVMHDRETGRSRGFGFVTMAVAVDEEPADAIARGWCVDGRPLRVRFADPEERSTASWQVK